MLRAGFGSSDSKKNPLWSGDHINDGTRLDEVSSEVVRLVDDCRPFDFAAPLDVERNGCWYRSDEPYE